MFAILAAARFAHFAAVLTLFGLAAFPFYALGPSQPSSRTARLLDACAGLALVTGILELLAMAANMGGELASAIDPGVLSAAVTDTVYGRVWAVRLLLALALVALRLARRQGRDQVLVILSGVLLASVGLTGHSAMPGGALGAAHQAADAAHLLAAGWWIGGLFALALWAPAAAEEEALALLQRFSGVGYWAVTVILATGVFKSVILVRTLPALFGSAYGQVLILKIVLFAGMVALALSNRFRIMPALANGLDVRGRLKTQLQLEFGLGMLVLLVAGTLGAMQPPAAS